MAAMATPPPLSTRPQGSAPASTPSMMVFMRMACGAGRSREPKVQARPSRRTVAATAQQAKAAPISWPSCCRAGVAPTRYPVFRSCEMSPAFDAAMATTVPTVRTAARAAPLVHSAAAKTVATPSRVTSVIPEVGCEETPTIPTMRAATATKRTPKIATPAAQTARGSGPISPEKMPGTRKQRSGTAAIAEKTNHPGRSRSRSTPADLRKPRATAAKAEAMVGSPRATVTIPATATAPAPM